MNTRHGVNRGPRWAAGGLRAIARRRAVILGYHGVAKASLRDDPQLLQVDPERFRSQLKLLQAAGFRFTTMRELVRLSAGSTPPAGLAAVTFDDGLRNNRTTALPIMQQLGIPGTVYVTTDFIGGTSPWIGPGGDPAMLTSEDLIELTAAGWEIGAHTVTHADLSSMDYDSCLWEISECRSRLEATIGASVDTFAYPFGRYGPAAITAARDAGMKAAVTTGSGRWDTFELTRAMIGAADPMPIMLLKLTDRYEPLLANPIMNGIRVASRRLRGALRNQQPPDS